MTMLNVLEDVLLDGDLRKDLFDTDRDELAYAALMGIGMLFLKDAEPLITPLSEKKDDLTIEQTQNIFEIILKSWKELVLLDLINMSFEIEG